MVGSLQKISKDFKIFSVSLPSNPVQKCTAVQARWRVQLNINEYDYHVKFWQFQSFWDDTFGDLCPNFPTTLWQVPHCLKQSFHAILFYISREVDHVSDLRLKPVTAESSVEYLLWSNNCNKCNNHNGEWNYL